MCQHSQWQIVRTLAIIATKMQLLLTGNILSGLLMTVTPFVLFLSPTDTCTSIFKAPCESASEKQDYVSS